MDTAAAAYVYFPTGPADTFHLGKGYFMQETNTQTSLTLTQVGTLAPLKSHNGTATARLRNVPDTLKTGWNLIGDPCLFAQLPDLQVQDTNGTITDVLTAQNGANPSLGSALWTYENGNYQVVFTLDAFRGYWIRAFRPVKLLVVPTSQQGRAAQPIQNTLAATGTAQGNGFKLNLIATADGVNSAPGIVGVHPKATDTYDLFKLEAPPAIGTRAVSLTFDHPDWAAKSGSYAVDVRSVATAQQKWTMNLNSNISGEPVTITWPNMADVPGKYDVLLTDEDAHTTIQMRNQSSYLVPAGKAAGSVTRHFTVSIQRATRSPLALTNISAIVNTGTRGPVSANIAYTLTTSATVQVNVTTRTGRTLRTIEQGVTRAAGTAQTVWDAPGRRNPGARGYLQPVEITATDSAGHKVRSVVPLILTGR